MRALTLLGWAFAMLLGWSAAPAAAQGPLYFYCYAPDPASGTVYMSQPQPVGPVAERAGYGAAYVAYLRSKGRISGDVQGYCTMRGSQAEIARAQAALPRERCPECGGIARFEGVAWPRGGGSVTAPPPPVVIAKRKEPPAPAPAPGRTRPKPAPVSGGPLIVVMGNSETGKLIKLSNQPNLLEAARTQARAIRPTGWETLLVSSAPGFGAAVCVETGGAVSFFVAHGLATQGEAIREARARAQAFAAEKGGKEKVCGAPWRAGDGPLEPREPGVIDVVKDFIREKATCDPELSEVDSVEAAEKGRRPDGRRPCVRPDLTSIGARG